MRENKGKIIAILILIGTIIWGNLAPQNSLHAQAATAKKTVTVTLDQKHPDKVIELTALPKKMKESGSSKAIEEYYKKYGICIKVEIMGLKGKPTKKVMDFYSGSLGGTGCLLIEFPPKKYKKGTIYKDSKKDAWHLGSTKLEIGLPKGVKKVTYKITFSNRSGKRTLKNVTVKN